MEKFILIDGFAILHRAYHAFPQTLTTRSGELVNAVYGFTRLILRINEELKPDYWAVAMDLPGPTFRNEIFVGYQAQRPISDQELRDQIDRVYQILGALNVPVFSAEGYEADDVIGSIAKKLQLTTNSKQQRSTNDVSISQVIIVTGDRDILQLVGENVSVYLPQGGFSEGKIFDAKAVEEYLGVKPEQIIDYKALVGDPSDNYPGVSGIGPKTAVELIKKYETLDGIYENIGEIRESVAKKLTEGHESALLSQQLAKIATDVPVVLGLEACRVKDYDKEKAMALFEKLEFKSLIARLPGLEFGIENLESRAEKKKREDDSQMGLF